MVCACAYVGIVRSSLPNRYWKALARVVGALVTLNFLWLSQWKNESFQFKNPSLSTNVQIKQHSEEKDEVGVLPKSAMVVVDCDNETLDMVLNSWLCWAKLRGSEKAAEEFHVLCLSSQCCDVVSFIGMKTIGKDDIFEMYLLNRKGFQEYKPRSYLDDVMVARELVVQHLLFQGYSILRADADACFTKDIIPLVNDPSLGMLVSAQDPGKQYHQSAWANNYSCNGTQFLTLNNGLALLKGQRQVASFYSQAVGRSLRIMSEANVIDADGFGQKGFNEEALRSDFCIIFGSDTWNGEILSGKTNYNESPNFGISIFSVCSSCDKELYCGSSFAVHANCLQGHNKVKFLEMHNVWYLRKNWAEILPELRKNNLTEVMRSLAKSSLY